MCLVLLAHHIREDLPLLLLCNRDEFFDRSTAPLRWWVESPDILAGRDQRFGGTWLAVKRDGRFALLTNFRNALAVNAQPGVLPQQEKTPIELSRGDLVVSFLKWQGETARFLEKLSHTRQQYKPFNLIFGSAWGEIFFFSSEENSSRLLSQNIYGLSNASLDTPWPKVTKSKEQFRKLLKSPRIDQEALFEMMKNEQTASDESLPKTGVPLEWERALSPIFIRAKSMNYGTRSTSLVLFEKNRRIRFIEKSYGQDEKAPIVSLSYAWSARDAYE